MKTTNLIAIASILLMVRCDSESKTSSVPTPTTPAPTAPAVDLKPAAQAESETRTTHYLRSGDPNVFCSHNPQSFVEGANCTKQVWDCSGFANAVTCQRQLTGLCFITAGLELLPDGTNVEVLSSMKVGNLHLTGVKVLSGPKSEQETWVLSSNVK